MKPWYFIPFAPIAISLVFSFTRIMARQMAFHESPPCYKLGIDQMEPVISTRWFCEPK